jgi:plasmid stabilization system protein ParE
MIPVHIQPLAEADVISACDWYDSQSAGLGMALEGEFRNLVEVIAALPEAFPKVEREARRAVLRRFPYAIIYRLDARRVEILAFTHTSRAPDVWKARVSG